LDGIVNPKEVSTNQKMDDQMVTKSEIIEVIEQPITKVNECVVDEDLEMAVNKALLESDSKFCAVLDASPIPVDIAQSESDDKITAEPGNGDSFRIEITTPSSTGKSKESTLKSNDNDDDTQTVNAESYDAEPTEQPLPEVVEPMFTEETESESKKNELVLLENADSQLVVKTQEVTASATSSIDIPSLEDLVKSMDTELELASMAKDDDIPLIKNLEIEPKADLKASTEGMVEIMEQLKILEMNEVMMNTADIIDLKIAFQDETECGDQKEESQCTFPIPLTITIDVDEIMKSVMQREGEKKRIAAPTPPTEKIDRSVIRKRRNSLGTGTAVEVLKKSPRIKKLQKSLSLEKSSESITNSVRSGQDELRGSNSSSASHSNKTRRNVRQSWRSGSKVEVYSKRKKQWMEGVVVKVFVDAEGEWLEVRYGKKWTKEISRNSQHIRAVPEEDAIEHDSETDDHVSDGITPSNLISPSQWHGAESERKQKVEVHLEEDEATALMWKCVENNVMNMVNSAQQLKDITKLLEMKGVGPKQIDRRIRENSKVTTALQSVHGSIEWLRDIIIDSDYSHTLM